MKKTFMIAALVALFSLSCGNKKEETTQKDAIQEVAPVATNELMVNGI
jgi:predicted outer membrane protein